MQFFTSAVLAVSALAASAVAQSTMVAIYNMPDTVQAGQTTTLTTHAQPGPFTLILRKGDPLDLKNISTITTTGQGDSYQWSVDPNLESGSDYAIMIVQKDQSNYTPEFTITGGKPAGSGSSSASSSASAPGGYGSSAAPSTMSTAAKSASASNCAITQISDGQPQAPAGCPSTPAAVPATSAPAGPKPTPVPGFNSAAVPGAASPAPYVPMPGATGSPASSNSTMPTYSVPSTPTGSSSNSGSGSSSNSAAAGKNSAAPSSGAVQLGSSFALIAGAVAAFAFLN